MAALTVVYDGKFPVLSWLPYLPFPSGYFVDWAPGPEGPWTRLTAEALLVAQYRDDNHPITSDNRIYWRVMAQVGPIEVVHVLATAWVPPPSTAFVRRVLDEIKRRHTDIMLAKFGGESSILFIRRAAGEMCPVGHPTGDGFRHGHSGKLCPQCFNTAIDGGYVRLEDIGIRVRNSQMQAELRQDGIVLTEGRNAWAGAYPLLNTGDFFARPTGERFAISNVRRRELQGYVTLQVFNVNVIEPEHPLYDITEALLS